MSETAITGTIRAELNMLYAAGKRDILLTIGNYGEAFAREKLGLSMETNVKCSNFIGDTLQMAVETGFSRALLIGHIGKLVKLGIGITNTHSNHGDGRMETLITCALEAGADIETLRMIRECVSADAALECLHGEIYEKTMKFLNERIEFTLNKLVGERMEIGFICFRGMGENAELCFQKT
jgi:cobalt-precorrin-5B (C1)-methyltransferase